MNTFNKLCFVLLLSLFVVPAYALEVEGFKPDREVVYKTAGNAELKLHIFNPQGHRPSDKRAAIVFFFGGGWAGGSPSQFYPHCKHLASRGMVAMSAEYRVRKVHKTTPAECVKDGKSAIRWVRQNADKLGIDPERIAAGGGSAGGHVAAATAMVKGFDEDQDTSVSAKPNALVLFNPVFDNGPEGYGHDRVKDYWKEISPMHNISEKSPPTIVFLGTNDRLIPVSTAEKYKTLMEEKKNRCDLHLYEGQGHGFFNYTNTHYYDLTVKEMDQFLDSLGYFKIKPESSKAKKHLFILSGQSNMAGLNPNISFTPAVESAFGKENVIVVKDAQGGQPIRRWYKNWKPAKGDRPKGKDSKPQVFGDLYDRLMTKVNAAIKDVEISTVTFVWMQGERDAREKHGAVYADSFNGLIKQLSEDLKRSDINFVIGRLSDFDMDNKRYPHWTKIRDVQVQIASEDPHGEWVDTDDLNNKQGKDGQLRDDLHYTQEGYKILGQRFAEKAISLIRRNQLPIATELNRP